jgi:hypothetical protein
MLQKTEFLAARRVARANLKAARAESALLLSVGKRSGVGWRSFLCWFLTALPFG